MLPPFIIEQIRKREEERLQREAERPRLELPIPVAPRPMRRTDDQVREPNNSDPDPDRGVLILDIA